MTAITTRGAADLFRDEPDRFLDVGAGEVAYRRIGTGPDVLFLHGWPVSGATFRTLLPHLAEHVTCHVIDFPGAGSSRFGADTAVTIGQHITTVGRVVDQLGFDDVAVVGHDSGGLIARHALAGDPRLRALGLVNSEQHQGMTWRFRSFVELGRLPGFGAAFGWVAGRDRLRRNRLVLGSIFSNPKLLDGEFDEFFLQPLTESAERQAASTRTLRSFDRTLLDELTELHRRITVPVHLVWGDRDPFFPLDRAREMVDTFPNARLTVVPGAGLFSHEERPAEVAAALLPVLTGA